MKSVPQLDSGDDVIFIDANGDRHGDKVKYVFTFTNPSIETHHYGRFDRITGQSLGDQGGRIEFATAELLEEVQAEEAARAIRNKELVAAQLEQEEAHRAQHRNKAMAWYESLTPEHQDFVKTLAGRFGPTASHVDQLI